MCFDLYCLIVGKEPVLRMDNFQPIGAAAKLAVAANTRAAGEPCPLALVEVKEPKERTARPVRDHTHERPAPAVAHLCELDLCDDDRISTLGEGADGSDAGAILLARRQVKEQVLYR